MKALLLLLTFTFLTPISGRAMVLPAQLSSSRAEIGHARVISEPDLNGFGNHPDDWNTGQPVHHLFEGRMPKFRLKLTKHQFQQLLGTPQTLDEMTFLIHANAGNHALTNGLRPGNCGSGFCLLTNGEYLNWQLFSPDVLLIKGAQDRKWQMYDVPFKLAAEPFREAGPSDIVSPNIDPDAAFLVEDRNLISKPSVPRVRELLRLAPQRVVRRDVFGQFLTGSPCVIMSAGTHSTGVLLDKNHAPCVWQMIQYPPSEPDEISLKRDQLVVEYGNGDTFLYQ